MTLITVLTFPGVFLTLRVNSAEMFAQFVLFHYSRENCPSEQFVIALTRDLLHGGHFEVLSLI